MDEIHRVPNRSNERPEGRAAARHRNTVYGELGR